MFVKTRAAQRKHFVGLRKAMLIVAIAHTTSATPLARAGVDIDLELTMLGEFKSSTTGKALFQHTNTKHPKLDTFLTTQDDHSGTTGSGGATGGGNGSTGGGNGSGTGSGNGNGSSGGSGSLAGDGVIAAFNGSAADPGNPEAIFNGGTPAKTHTILLSDIPLTIDSYYRVFLFDANQNQSEFEDHVDITMIRVFTSSDPNLVDIGQLSSQNLIYDLFATDDINYVRIDGSVGTGGADMYFFLPNSLFTFPDISVTNPNVYLYYEYRNFNDGADAWSLDVSSTYVNPTTTPEPATMALWSVGAGAGIFLRSRRKRKLSALPAC